ncbi:MAG: DipZ protein [Solirubrobacterales bacterium]
MRPEREDIAAPELPDRMRWLNTESPPKMDELTAAGPVLVHFFDFAQLNSVRAMPYVVAWNDRYRDHGLSVLGVHSPRLAITSDPQAVAAGLERLCVRHPVAADVEYRIWHDYGCRGWPSLFLWGRGGALRWFHFGEGEYVATELAIQEALGAIAAGLPKPLAPLRDTDAPDALVAPPTDEVYPGGSATQPWRSNGADGAIALDYAAGGVHASATGTGELRAIVDGGEPWTVAVDGPGLYDLAMHPRHESHRLRLEADPGVEVYSVSFSAGIP